MALHSLYCADVPWRNCSLTHSHGRPGPAGISSKLSWNRAGVM